MRKHVFWLNGSLHYVQRRVGGVLRSLLADSQKDSGASSWKGWRSWLSAEEEGGCGCEGSRKRVGTALGTVKSDK